MYQVTYASGVRQIMYFMENPREYSINDRTYLLISTKTKVFMLYENGTEVHITGKAFIQDLTHATIIRLEKLR
jgi:hypothetical protein